MRSLSPTDPVYFVCATPRSGSTLLCETLKATGVAGCPDEYFEALLGTDTPRRPHEYFADPPPGVAALLPDVPAAPAPELEPFDAYLRSVVRRATTPNGVFGAKLMWGYIGDFAGRLRTAFGFTGDARAVLPAAFPTARYVQIVRRGKVEQAVSLWKALQTQDWREPEAVGGGERREPVYHEGAIRYLVAQLEEHERRWSAFFEALEVTPLVLSYEQIGADLEAAVIAVLRHIGVPVQADLAVEPPLRRQADERSREWVERFAGSGAVAEPA
jgi:LPS sulfotransferase NodH